MQDLGYSHFLKFILRTPLYPINFLDKLLSRKETDAELVKKACCQNEILESIFLASPNLYDKLEKWGAGELKDAKENQNLLHSVYKYLARLTGRSTPFGLFAGNSVGQINGSTKLNIPDLSKYRRVTRLDMNYLCALVQFLNQKQEIRLISRFFTNTSIYTFGNKLRYVEYHYENTRRVHHLAAVDNSDYLNKIMDKAKNGAYVQELTDVITDNEISGEEAMEFINELIDSQLLVPEFEPSVTGNDMLENILDFLKQKEIQDGFSEFLEKVQKQLQAIDDCSPGVNIRAYHEIAEELTKLGTNYDIKFLFQADMVKPSENLSVNEVLISEIKEGICVLNALSLKPQETNLTKFKDAFYKKHEMDEIPLLQAMDTESGIGYLQDNSAGSGDFSPLLDNLRLSTNNAGSYRFEWNSIHAFIFKKYLASIRENQYSIEITEKEVENLTGSIKDTDKLPVTISSMVQFIQLEGNPKIIISSAGGSCAANLLGRFCHTDNQILEHVQEIVSKEEAYYNDKVLAEIVHLPESRIGNILHRPVIRKYEIPYLAKSSVPDEFQVLPEDLMISVQNNRIILRSKRLNKEIIPRLTTAHNFSNNALPVYQFLCDMQTQDLKGGVGFNWGPLANQYPFLPRVCYKNLIFSLAAWNIPKQEFEYIVKIKNDNELLAEVLKWKDKHNMPEWVALEDGDNELPVKLTNLLAIRTLISTVKNRPNFKLTEYFADEDKMLVKNEEGSFVNEIIFSFYRSPNN